MKIKKGLSFVEYIAATEDINGEVKEDWLEWANNFVEDMVAILKEDRHGGDCTKECYSCPFCTFESMLTEYREYTFNKEE